MFLTPDERSQSSDAAQTQLETVPVRVNAQALNWFAGLMPVGGWIARLRLSAQPILRCLLSG